MPATPEDRAAASVLVTTVGDVVLAGTECGLDPRGLEAAAPVWVPAVVPGGVHESLLAAGLIEHPYRDRNEVAIAWIEERDWWYRTTLRTPTDLGPDERLELAFHGLDTVAEIWLDGVRIGTHQNMFRPARYDITEMVSGADELLVRFSPPLAGLEPAESAAEQLRRIGAVLGGDDEAEGESIAPSPELAVATRRRKAMFSWGWDFGPRVPSLGIWRPVELVRWSRARATGHHVRTDAVDVERRSADVTVRVEAESSVLEIVLDAEVVMTSPDGREHREQMRLSEGVGEVRLHLSDAALWWTHDLGDPALYDVRITLREGDQVRDEIHDRVGIRTIALDRPEVPGGGRLFRFLLNGVPIFARGANWLPPSMLVGSIDEQRYRDLVRLARDGGMTMLRVWGGGIYEHDAFYTATDELGVLVWQDFMFACADYPSEEESLQREVALEAAHQVRRLRNRASLALWCGNNEVHALHGIAYQQYEPGNWGWDFYHRILPDAVAGLDGATPYWPGSPWGEDTPEGFMAVNGVLDGDRHAWEVWHGYDFGAGGGDYATPGEARHYRRYANDTGRFISEFGVHAAPSRDTLERWISPTELALHGPTFDAHNKDHPKDKGDALLEIITGLPTTLDEYVDATMVSQAEALKFGIEHYRRRQPLCGGTLVWQLNDVWPGLSWSVIDHDLVPKAGYHACRRAYQPVLASFVHDGDELSLWVANSGRSEVTTTAVVTVETFDGGHELRVEVPVHVHPGTCARVWSGPLTAAADRFAWVESVDAAFEPNRLFFAEIKDLPLPRTALRHRVERTGPGTATVTVEADAFTYLARVTCPDPGVRIDDNYVDLRAGDRRVLQVSGLVDGAPLPVLRVGAYAGPGRLER